ncbi:unnamed protein product [Caenorhabditis auriculariae]|uniref:Uncharacterized protein n=1 Tax=Caenorhabditis auriculariae TaxID=2777116 RepID=A0A8S1HQB8_9PELO|nr:unnamed protein product [Caenorhabditis auriculariae]
MKWRFWVWLATAALLLNCAEGTSSPETSTTAGECPEKCEPCAKLSCKDTVLDACGCCPTCVRQVGESCGTAAEVCASHLTCTRSVSEQESSRCVEMVSEDCLNAPCSVVFHPKCPDDSRLIILEPPPGECCGSPGKCHCDQQKCDALLSPCEKGKERVLVVEGKGVPGSCCDKYECRKREHECASVHCPSLPFDEDAGVEECPEDSLRPPVHVPKGTCCPVRPKCRCRGSICRPATCPEGQSIKILKKGNGSPGRCCDDWTCQIDNQAMAKECLRDGKVYKDGEEWHSNNCDSCKCNRGVAMCNKMACPQVPPHCTWIVIPDGECCPVCFGCQTDAREKKKKHEKWQKDDCTSCTCSEEGEHVCMKHMCKTDCENPQKISGECCPVCDEPTVVRPPATCPSLEHCPLRCENGLRRDDWGCYVCECLPVDHPIGEECSELNEKNCDKQCAHGYLKDNGGCVVCKCAKCPPLHQCFKHCLYGFETNSAGCPVCKCRESSENAKNASTHLEQLPGSDKCYSASSTGRIIERDGGEWWSDGCRHCFCEQKKEFCSLISCPSRPADCPEEKWIQHEDECCPFCSEKSSSPSTSLSQKKHEHTVCQSPGTGRLFTDGETWDLTSCVSCTCRVGHVLCRTAQCPPIPCDNPKFLNGDDCCPKCPLINAIPVSTQEPVICEDESGHAHKSGSSWRTDDCTSCTCTAEGKTECFREACEDTSCRGSPLVVKGRCCPVCSDVFSSTAVCSYQSTVYAVGEQWQDGHCSNCSCVAGGQTHCRQMVCPHCEDPVPIEGHCCPLCKDAGWAPYGLGNGSMTAALPPLENTETKALPLLGFSFMGLAIFGLLFVLFLLYKRSKRSNRLHKFSEVGHMSSGASSVRLSATKAIGSMPRLVDWQSDENGRHSVIGGLLLQTALRRESQSDGQSDSLISTISESSATASTASSGRGTITDTEPLTGGSRGTKRFPV